MPKSGESDWLPNFHFIIARGVVVFDLKILLLRDYILIGFDEKAFFCIHWYNFQCLLILFTFPIKKAELMVPLFILPLLPDFLNGRTVFFCFKEYIKYLHIFMKSIFRWTYSKYLVILSRTKCKLHSVEAMCIAESDKWKGRDLFLHLQKGNKITELCNIF